MEDSIGLPSGTTTGNPARAAASAWSNVIRTSKDPARPVLSITGARATKPSPRATADISATSARSSLFMMVLEHLRVLPAAAELSAPWREQSTSDARIPEPRRPSARAMTRAYGLVPDQVTLQAFR